MLSEFAREFEDLYYWRMESWVHFVCQSVHLFTHIGPETFRAGPLACYAQWTLETAIGNLGREIRQDRDLYVIKCAIAESYTHIGQAQIDKSEVRNRASVEHNREDEDHTGTPVRERELGIILELTWYTS